VEKAADAVFERVESVNDSIEDARALMDSARSLVDPFLSDSGLASLEMARTATEFVADVSKTVVDALLRVAERVPMAGQCAGVLKDIFALYQVRACAVTAVLCGWEWVQSVHIG
jgi:hypothetical protein